jgi:hypothetical protein
MMNGGCGQLDVLMLLVAALLVVAAATRRRALCVCRRCGTVDQGKRKWRFCARCGSPRSGSDGPVAAPPKTITATVPPLTGEQIPILPSELLRRAWCREPALDDAGCEVSPTSATAVAWSIWGACDRAFEPHSRLWRAWRQELENILRSQYGGVSAHVWNRHPSRRRETVLAVAASIEQRIGISRDGGRGAPRGGLTAHRGET